MDDIIRLKKNMNVLDKWMRNREQNKTISGWLKRKKVKTVGIYGLGILGKHLLWELTRDNINVLWVMDKDRTIDNKNVDIVHPDDKEFLQEVDIIIVTPITCVEEIEKMFYDLNNEIYSIEEIINAIESGEKI